MPEQDLRILALDRIVPHEDFDERRITALAERIQRDGVVRNPPIVAPLGDGRFVVLDGANRVSALKYLEYRDAIVQVVDYQDVRLSTWHHLVTDYQGESLLDDLQAVEDIRLEATALDAARQRLSERQAIGHVTTPGGQTQILRGGDALMDRAAALREVVQAYNGRADIHRVQTDDLSGLLDEYENIAALVVFPRFTPDDVIHIVREGGKLPSGLSRHVIPGRALRVNYELARLADDEDRDAKNRWLDAWIRRKRQAREIRYYEEPTVLYDE